MDAKAPAWGNGKSSQPRRRPGRDQAPDGLCSPRPAICPPHCNRFRPAQAFPHPLASARNPLPVALGLPVVHSTFRLQLKAMAFGKPPLTTRLFQLGRMAVLCVLVTSPLNFDPFLCSPSRKGAELCPAPPLPSTQRTRQPRAPRRTGRRRRPRLLRTPSAPRASLSRTLT